jgi:hypothetical protein
MLEDFFENLWFVSFVLVLSLTLCAVGIACVKSENIGDVRLILWLWAFMATLTSLSLYVLVRLGYFIKGSFDGPYYKQLSWFFEFMTDLEADILIPLALFSLFAVPHMITFVICSIFGYAILPNGFSFASKFLFWSSLKSLPIIAGVHTGWMIVTFIESPLPTRIAFQGLGMLASGALLFLAVAFIAMYGFRELTSNSTRKLNAYNDKTDSKLRKILRWCSRNINVTKSL